MHKKYIVLIFSFFIGSLTFASDKDSLAVKYAATITAADLSQHLHILASDSLEGRESGMKGQRMAADYLKNQFKDFGLKPIVKTDSGYSYFQKFNLVKKEWGEVFIRSGKKKYEFLKDFYAYGDLKVPEAHMQVVFGGYGIESQRYSDYEKLDVKGKAVIIYMGEPMIDGISMVTGKNDISDWANDWRKKAATAKEKGAAAVMIVVGNSQEDFNGRLKALKHHIESPSLGFTHKTRPGSAFFLSGKLASELLRISEEELKTAKGQLGNVPTYKLNKKKPKISVKVAVKESMLETENVLGFVEGTDKKDEVIVITAHYDHLGIEHGDIHYGADDDGSGTVALIEMAQAFAEARKNGHGPRRSILFMPVTAEEKGLMGSEYYTDFPVVPLANTMANLNIDMIGRIDTIYQNDPDYVYIIGSDRLSKDLHVVSERAAGKYVPDIKLDYTFNKKDDPNRFYYRSDHYNFAKNNIPVIFYFNGVHEDYHKPTDTVDKILFPKMEKITRLIFHTAWDLANMEEKLTLNENIE